jgi:hypothetical protein
MAGLRIVRARDGAGLGRMPGIAEQRSFKLNASEHINPFTLASLIGVLFSASVSTRQESFECEIMISSQIDTRLLSVCATT